MRRRQDQVAFTRSTVGFEGELHAIRLLLIDEDPVSGQKIMGKTGSGEVLEIFPKTKNRIHCVTDTKVTSAVFRADIERIAALVGYDLSDISHSNIFEFVTLPTDDLRELKDQFNEIVRIEKDLIHYILKQKKDKPRLELICVKSWIDDYNDRYPDSPLPPSQDSSRMYILLKYSCKELIKEAQEKEDEQKNEISERADFIQNKLMHYVQYNFVMALDTKMGSQLIQVFEANSHISENLNKIKELKEQKESVRELCRSGELSEEEADVKLQAADEIIENLNLANSHLEIRKSILRDAEDNAQNACEFIRSQFYQAAPPDTKLEKKPAIRKLHKLEGFFFLIAMRILTETSFIYLSSSSKNKYLFFLKTNLSDLVHCLSDNDRLLLRETAQWSQTQKNHLLMLIAGSEEALKFRIHEEFSVQDVIESVLGWRQDALPLCDRLPNTPTKPYDPISVPKWMHRKTKGAPSSRALLEYRYNARRILRDAKEDMGLMLKRANDFCKTTHLRKSEWINFDKENTSHYLNRQDIKTSDKSWLMHGLKRYKPLLFNKVRQGNLKEMREIERYELQSIKEKNEAQDKLRIADKNAAKALRFLSSLRSISGKDNPREYAHIKRILRKQLFHEDPDLSFKQMNLLYLTYKEKPIVSKDDWKSLQAILMELYAEKFFSIYHFPINSYEGAQIQYFMFRYSLTNEIPVLKEFLMFLKIFNQSEPDSFSISLVEKNQEIQLQYTFGQDTLESINDHHQDGTFLAYACRYGLGCMIHCLLDCGATADSNDLVEAFYSGVLTQDLAVRLLARGADAVQCFSDLAEEGDLEDIRKLTALLGIEKRDEAIASLSKESHSQHLADILTKSGFPDEADQGPVLHVFRKS